VRDTVEAFFRKAGVGVLTAAPEDFSSAIETALAQRSPSA